MDRLANLGELSAEERNRLRDLLDRLEQAWQQAESADLARFLPPHGDPLRAPALREFVKTDLEIRWRKGQAAFVESYLEEFPELAAERGQLLELLFEEYRIRSQYGDCPQLRSYQARFPDHFHDLEMLVQQGFTTFGPSESAKTTPPAPPAPAPIAKLETASGGVLPVKGYTLIRRLGSGGFGEVWRAEAPGGIEVAIKIIFRPLEHAEARRELEALELIKGLRHPYLLSTQAFWAFADRLLIALELADGSLRDRAKECGQGIPRDELLLYFREACEALDYLHAKHVLHRDVKPDNILLIAGHAKLADFGLARVFANQRSFSATTTGTPIYMAPEVWQGRASAHSDQYSLAATYAELRLQRPLYESHSMMELMLDHLERLPDLSPLPEAEQQVLLKALAKKPEQRYASCLQFWQALAAALQPAASRSGGSLPPGEAAAAAGDAAAPVANVRGPAPRRRLRGVFLGTGVLLALLLAAGLLLGTRPGRKAAVDFLPARCAAEEGASLVEIAGGKRLYDRIVHVLPDGKRIPLRLIRGTGANAPPPFYIMRDKVSNELFRAFAAAHPEQLSGPDWERGGIGADLQDLGARDGYPVFRVTADEAHAFALWLGGELPTPRQWDAAAGAGAAPEREGPFEGDKASLRPGVDIAIDCEKQGPMPVGTAARDQSSFGCRDMAGNGREWTRMITGKDIPVPFGAGLPASVELRGHSYRAPEPYQFGDLDEQDAAKATYDISFRVVIEIPPLP